MSRPPVPRAHRNERKAILVWCAGFMGVLAGSGVIGLDVANRMAVRARLENAAVAATPAVQAAVADKVSPIEAPDGAERGPSHTPFSLRLMP
ncbi:MAG TPA: hypothetical protein VEY91_03625 [Candidatus Limnocylindria bacterium]|nr:hypothetical protein [Candidatus Limnocylindria bacterium]